MSNDTVKPRMSPAELREACFHVAGAAVVSYVLGCVYEDAAVTDDGSPWPTPAAEIDLPVVESDPDGPWGAEFFSMAVPSIYEAGGLAALKLRGLGSHSVTYDGMRTDTIDILDDPKVWGAVEALAAHIEGQYDNNGDVGFCSALGTHAHEPGEHSAAIEVIKNAGLYPGYWRKEGESARDARRNAAIEAMRQPPPSLNA